MDNHFQTRGVIVYSKPMHEIHSTIGIYTEEGLLYATVYGARSTKGSMYGSDKLFIMGQFFLESNKKKFNKLYDIQIYENCRVFASHLTSYYIACVCAEFVKLLKGVQHTSQFKTLVDLLLYLVKICNDVPDEKDTYACIGMCLFLWRSLFHNGWQPKSLSDDMLASGDVWILEMSSGNFIPQPAKHNYEQMIHSCIIKSLQNSDKMSFGNAAHYIHTCYKQDVKQDIKDGIHKTKKIYCAMQHLLYVWQHIFERKIWSAQFLLK